jgi:hypothetical protein
MEASRVTPDGSTVVFESAAQLTGYENNGKFEIYRRVDGQPLECVSCNPSGTPALSDARLQNVGALSSRMVLNNLSADGTRVFFETEEALLEADTDGINDSYEWRALPGSGAEPELGLISSGGSHAYPLEFDQGLEQNTLFGITKSGSDVFFKAQDPLVPGAGVGGTPAIYDARIGGGFPQPSIPEPCSEEGCRPPASPPPLLGAASSSTLQGAGNLIPRKGKHRHHRRCNRRAKHRGCSKKRSAAAATGSSLTPLKSGDASGGSREGDSASQSSPPPASTTAPSPITSAVGDEFQRYGIESANAEVSTAAAAQHPDFTFTFSLNTPVSHYDAKTKESVIKLPPGLYGNPNLTPRCAVGLFLVQACPIDSQIGVVEVEWAQEIGSMGSVTAPLYNLVLSHPDREIARFAFDPVRSLNVFIDVSVRTAGDYGITTTVHSAVSLNPLRRTEVTVWGNPADSTHDKLRMTPNEAQSCPFPKSACKQPGGERPTEELGPIAFMTNPSACGPWSVGLELTSYQLPGQRFSADAPIEPGPVDECHDLPFAPILEARPTTDVAAAPTGLQSKIRIPQHEGCALIPGSEVRLEELRGQREIFEEKRQKLAQLEEEKASPEEIQAAKEALLQTKARQGELNAEPFYECEPATATMREAKVTLPEGMTINPSAADGLAACSDQQVHLHEELDAQCPDASKIGSLKIVSPALAEPLVGAVYQRSPQPGHLFGLWLVSDALGLHVKIPGEVNPDPNTGQLTAVFSDLPQVPVQEIDLDIWGGARAPLKTPDTCGSYETTSSLTPWSSDPPASPDDRFQIDRGPSGGPCNAGDPSRSATPADRGARPFAPGYDAGTTSPLAGQFSPFALRVTRQDGEQELTAQQGHLPQGLLAKLAGVAECSEADIARAQARSNPGDGALEQLDPSCPAASHIGRVQTAAGAGPAPYWVKGEIYLGGPYRGAPLSLVIIAPAVAGPFDLGTVVVHDPLYVDPQTGEAHDAAVLPTILEGVPLNLRTVAVDIDRPDFILNPTSCDPMTIAANIGGAGASLVDPADDILKPVSERFQVAECKALKFQPKLTLALKGSTKRTSNPALIADLRARHGEANIARAQVKLPKAAFLDNSHIATICTRVQFAADTCPKGSVYGKAWATTPLLDYKLSGPVYLRSSDHPLPDLVVKLKGPEGHPIEFDLVGRTDAVKGALRNTFETVPDAPVSKFHLELFGGKRGVIELSSGLCRSPKASIKFTAQNGRVYDTSPKIKTGCAGKGGKGRHHHR